MEDKMDGDRELNEVCARAEAKELGLEGVESEKHVNKAMFEQEVKIFRGNAEANAETMRSEGTSVAPDYVERAVSRYEPGLRKYYGLA